MASANDVFWSSPMFLKPALAYAAKVGESSTKSRSRGTIGLMSRNLFIFSAAVSRGATEMNTGPATPALSKLRK